MRWELVSIMRNIIYQNEIISYWVYICDLLLKSLWQHRQNKQLIIKIPTIDIPQIMSAFSILLLLILTTNIFGHFVVTERRVRTIITISVHWMRAFVTDTCTFLLSLQILGKINIDLRRYFKIIYFIPLSLSTLINARSIPTKSFFFRTCNFTFTTFSYWILYKIFFATYSIWIKIPNTAKPRITGTIFFTNIKYITLLRAYKVMLRLLWTTWPIAQTARKAMVTRSMKTRKRQTKQRFLHLTIIQPIRPIISSTTLKATPKPKMKLSSSVAFENSVLEIQMHNPINIIPRTTLYINMAYSVSI